MDIKTIYRTEDGTEFDSFEAAENYKDDIERELERVNIRNNNPLRYADFSNSDDYGFVVEVNSLVYALKVLAGKEEDIQPGDDFESGVHYGYLNVLAYLAELFRIDVQDGKWLKAESTRAEQRKKTPSIVPIEQI